ncbi:hypothetical protein X759_32050 [Mesorhizobium sp. LSHC420B00]|nr:hypothetical protein X759_32050 [Mesorhizobium sp. LSHC420B00]
MRRQVRLRSYKRASLAVSEHRIGSAVAKLRPEVDAVIGSGGMTGSALIMGGDRSRTTAAEGCLHSCGIRIHRRQVKFSKRYGLSGRQAVANMQHRQRSMNSVAWNRYLRPTVSVTMTNQKVRLTMDPLQNNTLEIWCLAAVPLSLLLTVLLAGFIL